MKSSSKLITMVNNSKSQLYYDDSLQEESVVRWSYLEVNQGTKKLVIGKNKSNKKELLSSRTLD
jgi:hypothetical protein